MLSSLTHSALTNKVSEPIKLQMTIGVSIQFVRERTMMEEHFEDYDPITLVSKVSICTD